MWRLLTPEQRIARLEALTDAMAKDLLKVIKDRGSDLRIAAVDGQRQILVDMYRESSAYANVIMLAGYAGMFAIWQLVNSSLNVTLRVLTGTMLIGSIMLFGGYELYKMIRNTAHLRRLALVLNRVPPEHAMEAWTLGLRQGYEVEHRIWIYFLIPTAVLGFGSGLMLLAALLVRLASGVLH